MLDRLTLPDVEQGRLKDRPTIERKIGRLHLRKPSLPDPEQALFYKRQRLKWKSAFLPQKTFAKP